MFHRKNSTKPQTKNVKKGNYRLGVSCNYVGPDYLTNGVDFVDNIWLGLFDEVYPDIYNNLQINNKTYLDAVQDGAETITSTQTAFSAFNQYVSRLILNDDSFSDEFIDALLDWYINSVPSPFLIQFITISQVWGGAISRFDKKAKLTSFPNRKSVGNLEIIIIKTNPAVVDDWKLIVDGFANDLDENVLSLLSDQLYVNYMTLYQDDYQDYFDDNDRINSKILKKLAKLKKKYDPNNLFTFQVATPSK